jgi:hypothetical protein
MKLVLFLMSVFAMLVSEATSDEGRNMEDAAAGAAKDNNRVLRCRDKFI